MRTVDRNANLGSAQLAYQIEMRMRCHAHKHSCLRALLNRDRISE
jgi:hypothetical protein